MAASWDGLVGYILDYECSGSNPLESRFFFSFFFSENFLNSEFKVQPVLGLKPVHGLLATSKIIMCIVLALSCLAQSDHIERQCAHTRV